MRSSEFHQDLPTIEPSNTPEGSAPIVIPEGTSEEKVFIEALRAEIAQLRDEIALEKNDKESWKYKATHDELTATLNRTGLAMALQNYTDAGSKIAFLFVDGLNIKAINHYKGYSAGDTAIIGLANILKGGMRPTDVVARTGGDEFLVALDVTQRGSKKLTAQQQLGEVQMRISTETEKYKNQHPEFASVGFEVSVGYAVWEPGMTIEEVKAEAEKVMKEHKEDQHEKLGAFRQVADS